MDNRSFAFFSALALASAAGYGCGAEEQPSTGTAGVGGAGGAGGSGSVASATGSSGVGDGGSVAASTGQASSGVGPMGSSGSSGGGSTSCTPTSGVVLAITRIYYGDTNFNDSIDTANGWKQYGFNVDGKVSTTMSNDLCKPRENAAPDSVYPDGDSGIDNSFGRNILPILRAATTDFSMKANEAITTGEYTLMLDLEGLGAAGDQASITTRIYSGTPLDAPPHFTGGDCWPVEPEGLLNPGDLASAKTVFPFSGMQANHWRSGPSDATIRLKIKLEKFELHLDVLQARLRMDLDADHQGAQIGHIGGVVATAQLQAEAKRMAGSIAPSACNDMTIKTILSQIAKASDILADGTQDPSKLCDAVSIGLGFKARAVMLGGVGPMAAPPPPSPCGP
jgi:hypothetical protein